MKLAIISPRFPHSGRVPLVPPILEYLAALTMLESPTTTIELFDANQSDIFPGNLSADLVAISAMTATAPWAYRFADVCRAVGKRVVLGGRQDSIDSFKRTLDLSERLGVGIHPVLLTPLARY